MRRTIQTGIYSFAFALLAACDTGYDPLYNRTIYSIKTTTGVMPQNETWSGELLLTGDVTIPRGIRLTIKPGTIVRFKARQDDQHWKGLYDPEDPSTYHAVMTCILIEGSLDAQGTEGQPILFTTDRAVPDTMDCHGFIIESNGLLNLEHVTLEHGYCGIQFMSKSGRAQVKHSILRDITVGGIVTMNDKLYGPIVLEDSQFIRCGRTTVSSHAEQNMTICGNVFAENGLAIRARSSLLIIHNNMFVNNDCAIGVAAAAVPNITENQFSQHRLVAVLIADAVPVLTRNNFDSNTLNVRLTSSEDVPAGNNWWGAADTAAIDILIEDRKDNPILGLLNYHPLALEAYDLDNPEYSTSVPFGRVNRMIRDPGRIVFSNESCRQDRIRTDSSRLDPDFLQQGKKTMRDRF